MIRPSNSGIAIWVAESSGVTPVVGGLPLRAAAGQAEPLQDRDVERRHPLDVPRLVVAAGARRRPARLPPAASTVTTSASRVPSAAYSSSGAERSDVGEDRYADRLAGRVDRVGQRVRERGVPARLVGPVVAAPRPAGCRRASSGRGSRAAPPRRDLRRRLEALAGQQHGVGEEGVQLGRGSPGRPRRGSGAPRRRRRSAPSTAPSARRSGCCSPPSTTTGMPASRHARRSRRAQVLRRAEDAGPTTRSAALDRSARSTGGRACRVRPARSRRPTRGRESRSVSDVDRRAMRVATVPPRGSRPSSSDVPWPVSGCAARRLADGRHSGGTAPDSHRVPVPRDSAGQPRGLRCPLSRPAARRAARRSARRRPTSWR